MFQKIAPLAALFAFAVYADDSHYSTLKQIDRSNVAQLQIAWTYESGDAFPGSEMQCKPLIVDGVLYATTPKLRLIALDAATGKLKWDFDPNGGRKVIGKQRSRGVAYWTGGHDSRIFFAARQNLYGIDTRTGKPVVRIDLRNDLGRDPREMSISMTSPPVIYKDLVITGSIVSETLPASPGYIRAYDARTGKLVWTFHTIPNPGEYGYDTWPKDAWTYIGGVNSWPGMTLDAARGLVFVPTGSASFDFYGSNRIGDNLFANCLIALDAATGKRVWHFQTVKHDLWDRDLPTAPALVTVMRDGQPLDAVAQPTKSGFVYLFERTTGKPLFPIEYRKYPASDVDGEQTADTQPLPTSPPPFARQILSEDMLTKRTPEAHDAVLERFRKLRSAGQFIPPSREGTIIFPGFDGGAEWGGPAFDPATGLLYVNANEMPWVLRLVERKPDTSNHTNGRDLYLKYCGSCHRADLKGTPPEFPSLVNIGAHMSDEEVTTIIKTGAGRMPAFTTLPDASIHALTRYVMFGESEAVETQTVQTKPQGPSPIDQKYGIDGYNKFLDPDGYPAVEPPWGTLNAIDLNSGKIAWKIPFGEYPKLVAQGIRNTGSENYGGPVVTASGLLFIGATNFDKKFHAFDKDNGKLLWETTLPAAGNATPTIYEVNGREYIVIAAGGGKAGESGGSYVAFALK
jgi:quinoprotein glucose dehydrogenase